MKNPFNFLQLAAGDQFYDRKELRKDLLSRFLSGQSSVVLYGPRRYGKSSLVAELVADLEKAGIPCVTLDVVKVPSIDLFVSAYATKVYRALAPVKFEFKKLGEFLKRLPPRVSIDSSGETGLSSLLTHAVITLALQIRVAASIQLKIFLIILFGFNVIVIPYYI